MKLPAFRTIRLSLAACWWLGSVILLLGSLTQRITPGLWADLYCSAVVLLSPAALAAFGWDKWKSERDGRRIPEKTLHLLSILGGWPGALAGQHMFRHKTLKPVFRTLLNAIVTFHVILTAWATYHAISS